MGSQERRPQGGKDKKEGGVIERETFASLLYDHLMAIQRADPTEFARVAQLAGLTQSETKSLQYEFQTDIDINKVEHRRFLARTVARSYAAKEGKKVSEKRIIDFVNKSVRPTSAEQLSGRDALERGHDPSVPASLGLKKLIAYFRENPDPRFEEKMKDFRKE